MAITDDGHRAAQGVYAPVVEAREMLERFTRDELEVLIGHLEQSRELLGAQTDGSISAYHPDQATGMIAGGRVS